MVAKTRITTREERDLLKEKLSEYLQQKKLDESIQKGDIILLKDGHKLITPKNPKYALDTNY